MSVSDVVEPLGSGRIESRELEQEMRAKVEENSRSIGESRAGIEASIEEFKSMAAHVARMAESILAAEGRG